MDKVELHTKDGVSVVGVWQDVTPRHAAALLLHTMRYTKESYQDFQGVLKEKGIASLAIDLRGHGESTAAAGGKTLDFRSFTNEDHAASREDVAEAMRWLREKTGLDDESLSVVGASIGANLALEYVAAHPNVRHVVALSPGLDYRGIVTMPFIKALTRDRRVMLVSSREDEESAGAVEKLAETSLAKTELIMFEGSSHGTDLFVTERGFMERVAAWLSV